MSFSSLRLKTGAMAALLLIGGVAAGADQPTKLPMQKKDILISPEAARHTLDPNEISVAAAEAITKACVEWGTARNIPLTVVVLTPSGNEVFAYRMDGKLAMDIDTARRKAETVLYSRMSTHALLKQFGNRMMATMIDLGQFPHTGGLPIMLGDQLIGAIGVGGAEGGDASPSTNDEVCAYEALNKVIGPQPPLTTDEPAR